MSARHSDETVRPVGEGRGLGRDREHVSTGVATVHSFALVKNTEATRLCGQVLDYFLFYNIVAKHCTEPVSPGRGETPFNVLYFLSL